MSKNNRSYSNNNNNQSNQQPSEEGYLKISLVNQSVTVRKKKSCPLRDIELSEINYSNIKLLNKFISERGKIIPSRITSVEVKKQRALSNAIKRARFLALISPIRKEAPIN
jgi:small subunit ribosomal protein S18